MWKLLAILVLIGCSDTRRLLREQNPFVVTSFESLNKNMCSYYFKIFYSDGFITKSEHYYINDVCGKYNVGDVLFLRKNQLK